jgi:hypothetical protein
LAFIWQVKHGKALISDFASDYFMVKNFLGLK